MEREIKFRGKDKFTNKWVFGDLVHNQKVTKIGLEPRITIGGYEVVEDTIGQFTGLKDKKVKDIYDGDIISLPVSDGVVKYVISFSSHHLSIQLKNIECNEKWEQPSMLTESWWKYFKNYIEVIGNIYDNPELLNK